MRRLLILAATLGTSGALAAHFSGADGKFDCPGISKAHACATAIETSLRSGFLRRVAMDQLDVTLNDGSVRSFKDVPARGATTDGASTVYYQAIEVIDNARYVLIHMGRYEWSEYGLLDRSSGRFTTFFGYPVFSPDYRWLAVVGGHENEQSIFQILEVSSGAFRMALDLVAFDASGRAWWPTKLRWTSSTSLAYGRTTLTGDRGTQLTTETEDAVLRFNGETWR
jgi:hypothetical protein